MKERIDYIDTTKGIGILLVVWLHMGSVGNLPKFGYWGGYITTFYMVLFFIMSGMFFKPVDIKRKVNRLMIPYISFYIIAFVIHSVKNLIKGESVDWVNFFVPLLGGTNGYENTPIWFLLSLSQVILISYLLLKFWNSKWIIVFSFLLSFAAFNCHKKFGVIPYYIDVTFVTIPFFLLGYYYKTQIIRYIYGGGYLPFIFFTLSVSLYCLKPGFANLSQNSMPQGFLMFAIVSIFASLGVIGMSRYITGHLAKVFQLMGRNSLSIMCTHMMFMTIDSALCRYIQNVIIANLVGLIIIIIATVFTSILISKYCPRLVNR